MDKKDISSNSERKLTQDEIDKLVERLLKEKEKTKEREKGDSANLSPRANLDKEEGK